MGSKSVGKNAILNVIKTFCSIAFPLITFPYVTRVLRAENLGKVNYANSIIQYFVLIAILGTATYATRECAGVRDDKKKLNALANEIFGLNIITFLIACIALFMTMVLGDFSAYKLLIIIYSTEILFKSFSFEWINSVFEDFEYITVRTIIVQLLSLALTFILVKKPDDYYKYAIIQTTSFGVISFANIVYTRRYLKVKPIIKISTTISHLRNSLVFFANSLAITIYCNSDITMIGVYNDDTAVGIYSVSAKIYTIIKNLFAAVLVVCIPRLSNYHNQGRSKEAQDLLDDITRTLLLITIPSACGLASLSEEIIQLVSGEGYSSGVASLSILSLSLVFAILGGIVNNCILIPIKQEKINLISTILAACVNFGLNFILIPLMGINGAAITTVLAEIVAFISSYILSKEVRKIFSVKQYMHSFIHALVGSTSIYFIIILIKRLVAQPVFIILISIALSGLVYLIELILFKDSMLVKFYTKYILKSLNRKRNE